MNSENLSIPQGMSDMTELIDDVEVYSHDCYNQPICQSYGETHDACQRGGKPNSRCTLSEKMQIRILNDMNPNATCKPVKQTIDQSEDSVRSAFSERLSFKG